MAHTACRNYEAVSDQWHTALPYIYMVGLCRLYIAAVDRSVICRIDIDLWINQSIRDSVRDPHKATQRPRRSEVISKYVYICRKMRGCYRSVSVFDDSVYVYMWGYTTYWGNTDPLIHMGMGHVYYILLFINIHKNQTQKHIMYAICYKLIIYKMRVRSITVAAKRKRKSQDVTRYTS